MDAIDSAYGSIALSIPHPSIVPDCLHACVMACVRPVCLWSIYCLLAVIGCLGHCAGLVLR